MLRPANACFQEETKMSKVVVPLWSIRKKGALIRYAWNFPENWENRGTERDVNERPPCNIYLGKLDTVHNKCAASTCGVTSSTHEKPRVVDLHRRAWRVLCCGTWKPGDPVHVNPCIRRQMYKSLCSSAWMKIMGTPRFAMNIYIYISRLILICLIPKSYKLHEKNIDPKRKYMSHWTCISRTPWNAD